MDSTRKAIFSAPWSRSAARTAYSVAAAQEYSSMRWCSRLGGGLVGMTGKSS